MSEIDLRFPKWIGVVCGDLEQQRHFYGDILGLREADRGAGWIEFDMGAGATFEILARSEEPQYDRPRYQVGFLVDDIRAARNELLSRGIQPVTDIVEGGTSQWAYFSDPEGNLFEIIERH